MFKNRIFHIVLIIGLTIGLLTVVTQFDNGKEKPNVVLIALESTRADHLPCYGYDRNTTPSICKFAEDGVTFKNAYSQGSHTSTSIPAMLTSLPASATGVDDFDDKISESFQTFPETLKNNGYTFVYEGLGSSIRFLPEHITDFETINTASLNDMESKHSSLDQVDQNRTLLWVTTQYAHRPYIPPENLRGKWENLSLSKDELEGLEEWKANDPSKPPEISLQQMIALYDESIRAGDEVVNEILDRLKEEGKYDDSMIIVTSDHGESLGEDGQYGHGHGIPNKEETHIPLIIKFPGNKYSNKIVEQPVRLTDIGPTLYDELGLLQEKKDVKLGKSLLPAIQGNELDLSVFSARYVKADWALLDENYTYSIRNMETCEENGVTGMCEDTCTKEEEKEAHQKLCMVYTLGKEIQKEPGTAEIGPEMEERLENMGYAV